MVRDRDVKNQHPVCAEVYIFATSTTTPPDITVSRIEYSLNEEGQMEHLRCLAEGSTGPADQLALRGPYSLSVRSILEAPTYP